MKKVLYFFSAAVLAIAMAACTKPAATPSGDGGGDQTAAAPVADFEYAINGMEVSFTNKSQNATAYKWDFGDEETSKEASPKHTYGAAGTYTVKLTAANADGATNSKEASITLAGAAKAYFTFTAKTDRAGHFGLTIEFDASASENAKSIAWDFGDGETGAEFKISHTYADYGTYNVKAEVTGEAGDKNAYEASVEVIAYNELLVGGGMEEDDAKFWTVVTDFAFPEGNYDTPDENTPGWLYEFGYTEDGPKGGKGGCIRFVNNQVHDQANNFKFYQAIEVEEGDYLELSAQMKWGEKTNDCGLLWFGIAENLEDVGMDGTSVVEMFNYWNPDWDNIGGNSILPVDGGFEANAAYIADNDAREIGYSNAGEPVAHYWAQKSGTVYFYVDYRSVWHLLRPQCGYLL